MVILKVYHNLCAKFLYTYTPSTNLPQQTKFASGDVTSLCHFGLGQSLHTFVVNVSGVCHDLDSIQRLKESVEGDEVLMSLTGVVVLWQDLPNGLNPGLTNVVCRGAPPSSDPKV